MYKRIDLDMNNFTDEIEIANYLIEKLSVFSDYFTVEYTEALIGYSGENPKIKITPIAEVDFFYAMCIRKPNWRSHLYQYKNGSINYNDRYERYFGNIVFFEVYINEETKEFLITTDGISWGSGVCKDVAGNYFRYSSPYFVKNGTGYYASCFLYSGIYPPDSNSCFLINAHLCYNKPYEHTLVNEECMENFFVCHLPTSLGFNTKISINGERYVVCCTYDRNRVLLFRFIAD